MSGNFTSEFAGRTPEDYVAYVEKAVLARGLRAVVEDRVLLAGNKTVIFR